MRSKDKFSLLILQGPKLPHNIGLKTSDKLELEYQDELIEHGISFFNRNFFSMFVCMLAGLLSLMYIESIAFVLNFTGRSGSAPLAFTRYLATLKHTISWYRGVNELKQSLKVVRSKHQHAANISSEQEHSMTQYDMVLTQWAFIGPALLYPKKLGISINNWDDFRGLVYIMYLVGRDLGIKEELNLCGGTDMEQTIEYSDLILKEIISKKFSSEDSSDTCKSMVLHLLNGVNMLNPFIDQTAFHEWTNQILSGQQQKETKVLSNFSHFLLQTQIYVLGTLMHTPTIGGILASLANNLMRLNIFLAIEWSSYMVDNYHKNHSGNSSIFGNAGAFLAIPVFTVISFTSMFYKYMLKNLAFYSFLIFSFLVTLVSLNSFL